MRGCLKTAVTLLGIALILGAIGALLLGFQADTYLKRGVEASIGEAAGAPSHVERFRILPLRQCIEIRGLTIDNPPGWPAEPAAKIESILVNFDAKSLFSENPRIKQVEINGARVNLSYDLARGANLSQLAKTTPDATASPFQALGRRFQIDVCRCHDVKVAFGGILPGKLLNLDLAPFTIKELDRKPVSAGEATGVFLRSVMLETLTMKGILKPVGEKLKEMLSPD